MEPAVSFEVVEQRGDGDQLIRFAFMRIEQYMHMFRHDHIPDQADMELRLQPVQCINDDLLHAVVMKESQTAIGRNSPEVDVARFVNAAQMGRHVGENSNMQPSIRVPHL